MKFCQKCGKELLDEAVVCIHCGCPQSSMDYRKDKADTVLVVLCVLFPIVGLILWALKHEESPKAAAAYGKAALIAVGVEIGLAVLISVLIALIFPFFVA